MISTSNNIEKTKALANLLALAALSPLEVRPFHPRSSGLALMSPRVGFDGIAAPLELLLCDETPEAPLPLDAPPASLYFFSTEFLLSLSFSFSFFCLT